MIWQSTLRSLLLAGLMGTAAAAHAHDYEKHGIFIDHPWARPTPPVEPINAAAYLTIENRTDQAISLTGVSTPVTDLASIHQSREVDGMMSMAEVEGGLEIPAKGRVALEPLSYHLMLMNLGEPLKMGDQFALTLQFDDGQAMEVQVMVEREMTAEEAHHHAQ